MDTKTKLFIALAVGRSVCGFCSLTGILFLMWLTTHIGKTGLSLFEILGTASAVILSMLFASKKVLSWSASVPYKILAINSTTFMVDALVILLVADEHPYTVLVTGVISAMCDKAYLQSRKILINRVYHGDELSLIGNRLEVIAVASGLAGSALAIEVPADTTVIAIIVMIAAALLTISNYYQIKYLLMLSADDTFRERIAKHRSALREQYLNNGE